MRAGSVFFSAQGSCAGEIAVRPRPPPPKIAASAWWIACSAMALRARRPSAAVAWLEDRRVGLGRACARARHQPVAVLGDHRQRALRQVAEVVGEVGIGAVDDRLMAVVAVLAERHLAQQEIAHLVEAVVLDQRERVDDIADRLRHLLAAVEQEAVAEHALRQFDARRHQEGRPVDRVEAHDVLADDVDVGRPVAPAFGRLSSG